MAHGVTVPGNSPYKITKWKVKKGQRVAPTTILALYQIVGSDKINKLKCNEVGTVKELLLAEGQDGKSGSVVLMLEGCQHPTVMKDMCAECGADLRLLQDTSWSTTTEKKAATSASVAMVHSIPELIVSEEQALELGREDEQRLLKNRKLVLLVDLDQTLLHTTNDTIPPNLKDVEHFQLWHGHWLWYHTKFRPGTKAFLESISQLYELHICTFGVRLYAHTIAGFIDPDKKYFSHRILSRDECFSANSKTANLKSLFPCGDSMVGIIDDRDDVWKFAPNLIHVKPYHFFCGTADINAPPGLGKESDDSQAFRHNVNVIRIPRNKKTGETQMPVTKTEQPQGNVNDKINDKGDDKMESSDMGKDQEGLQAKNTPTTDNTVDESPIKSVSEKNYSDKSDAVSSSADMDTSEKEQKSVISVTSNSSELLPEDSGESVNKENSGASVENLPKTVVVSVDANLESPKEDSHNIVAVDKSIKTDLSDEVGKVSQVVSDDSSSQVKDMDQNGTKVEQSKTGLSKVDSVEIEDDLNISDSDESENEDMDTGNDGKSDFDKDGSDTVTESKTSSSQTKQTAEEIDSPPQIKQVDEKLENKGDVEISAVDSTITSSSPDEKSNGKSNDVDSTITSSCPDEKSNGKSNDVDSTITSDKSNDVDSTITSNTPNDKSNDVDSTLTSNTANDKSNDVDSTITSNTPNDKSNDVDMASAENSKDGTKSENSDQHRKSSEKEEGEVTSEEDKDGNDSQKLVAEEYDEVIEWEDTDDYLIYLEDVLKRIHAAYYEMYDEMKQKEAVEIPDMKRIIPYVRRKVLQGANIVFSGVIPMNQPPEKSRAYNVAKALGANVHVTFVPPTDAKKGAATTHLVAAKVGTAKVMQAKKHKQVHIVNPDWLWTCTERWEWVDERLFQLTDDSVYPYADSPDPWKPRKKNKPKDPAPKEAENGEKDPKQGNFQSYNPLFAFSTSDIKKMGDEVDEIFDESDSEDSDSELRRVVLGFGKKRQRESSSDESMTAEFPKGWGKKKKRSPSGDAGSCEDGDIVGAETEEMDDDDNECEVQRKIVENPDSFIELSDQNSNHSSDFRESIGSIDDEMAAALEKEFLSY